MLVIELSSLALHVRAVVAALHRTFIERDACPLHGAQKILDSALDVTSAVGIFYAQHVDALMMARKEEAIQRCAQRADVDETCRRRSKSDSDL